MPLSDLDKRSLDCPIYYDDYDEYVHTKELIFVIDHPIRLHYTITEVIRSPLYSHIFDRYCLEEYFEASLLSNIRNYKCPI
jgi:hypothetical protein